MAKLTDKQKNFVAEYLVDLNATQAAIRAKYSAKTAQQMAAKNMAKPEITRAIAEAMKKREQRTKITQDRVLKELADVAFADIDDYVRVAERVGESGIEYTVVELAATGELPRNKRAAIASIKSGANGIELKLYDKLSALDALARHLGMYNDKLQLSGAINNPYEGLTTEELKKLISDG